jgi:ribosomal protein S18 acetylase RimI-like enzyme
MITYQINAPLTVDDVIRVFRNSGIRRPIDQPDRIQEMIDHANLIVSAWDGQKLIGIGRALTDFSFCCYLSDLAVDRDYQRSGIGRALVKAVLKQIGDRCSLILLSAPEAMEYYPKLGFEEIKNGFMIKRSI